MVDGIPLADQVADADRLGPFEKVSHQAGLADPGLALDDDRSADLLVPEAMEAPLQGQALGGAPDHRPAAGRRLVLPDFCGAKEAEHAGLTLQDLARQVRESDPRPGLPEGGLVAKDVSRCGLHEARRQVHDIPHDRVLASQRVADLAAEGRAAGHADRAPAAESGQGIAHLEGGQHRALGIVTVCQGRQAHRREERHALLVHA